MMFAARRPTSRIDVCNYNTLLYRDYDANVNFTKNYFLSQSPPPMTYRDLRSVMSNITPSNVVILSEPSNPSQLLNKPSSTFTRRKHSTRKKHKRQTIDVYRTLARAESRLSLVGEREITNVDMMQLASSFVIDHVSPSPTNGFFHPQNLPNIQKNRIKTGNNPTKSTYTSSPSLRIEHVDGQTRPTTVDIKNKDNLIRRRSTSQTKTPYPSPPASRIQHIRYLQPSPPQLIHRTTPIDIQYEENNSQIATTTTMTTTDSSVLTDGPIRKQLHVYMPQIISC